ncbi:hypothetical protein DXB18_14290 [Clostridium sp. OM02-18AC]|uniref:acyltransferase family protein n=1 Tax=Clostridium sp. OM02-18AC TaxID=2292311 RepID=UPI000E4B65CC|nr:acyltransferase family protein [Clostridium sp. OM02-18AC]RHV63245.1 hypothetical protein DXB18_14290 [Clostridium sp. OM02-18AC]
MVQVVVNVLENKEYEMNAKRKNNIELDRFMLALPVCLMHIGSSTMLGVRGFSYGGYAVECFLVLSGFFLARMLEKETNGSIFNTALNITKSRFKTLAPYYYLCFATTFLYKCIYYYRAGIFTQVEWSQFLNNALIELLCLNGLFYRTMHVNGPGWYISALLFGGFIVISIYLIIKRMLRDKSQKCYIYSSLILFFIYMYVLKVANVNIERIIRTLVSLWMGMAAWNIYKKFSEHIASVHSCVLDILEIILIIMLVSCFFSTNLLWDRKYITLIFALFLVLQYCGNSNLDKIFSLEIFGYMGKLSLPIYLGQMLVICKYAFNPGYDITAEGYLSYILILFSVILWSILIECFLNILKNKKNIVEVMKKLDNRYLLFFSIVLFITSFSNDRVFFVFQDMSKLNWMVYISSKIILLILEVTIPQYFFIKIRKKIDYSWLKSWVILFGVYTACLLLVWPGIWNNDEFLILGTIQHWDIQFHQSLLTNLFYILSIMIYPSCGTIIWIQVLICSFIGAYSFNILKKKNKYIAYALYIALLMPPTIYYILYPLRVTLYSFLMLYLFAFSVELISETREITLAQIVKLGIMIALISFWRIESRFFIIVLTLLWGIWLLVKHKKTLFIWLLASVFLPFGLLSHVNNAFVDKKTSQIATLNSFVTGISILLTNDELRSFRDMKEVISSIDKIMSIRMLIEHSSATDLYAVYGYIAPYDFTDDEYRECLKSVAELIICNPIEYSEAKYELFAHSVAAPKYDFWISPAKSITDSEKIAVSYGVSPSILKIYRPFNEKLRSVVSYFLTGMYVLPDSGVMAYSYMWNLWVPILFLIFGCIILSMLKNWYMLMLNISIITDFLIVYMTAPSVNSMYFYPFYLVGVFWFSYILILILKKKNRK